MIFFCELLGKIKKVLKKYENYKIYEIGKNIKVNKKVVLK